MNMNNAALVQRDLQNVWHPCTQMKDFEQLPLIPIRRGQGVWLEDFDGNRYIDAISSWWVTLFGHSNSHINQALKKQVDSLEHVILAGCTHEPVVQLSEKLAALTPGDLHWCFYAENGSSAVEIALKMSFHYWKNHGQPDKTNFISLENSYHGETFGALAVGDVPLYKETYQPLLLRTRMVPSPDCYHREPGESWEAHSLRKVRDLEHALQQYAGSTCAVIVEPLVQCAGHMRMYHPVYLRELRRLCDQYQVHFIADEVAVGFGRTGTLFGCEQGNVTPDFMCLAKGLTGGYLPLSVVMTNDHIYQAFYDDYETLRAFLHSHSYTGNALSCAVALATLELFERDDVIERNRALAAAMATATEHFIEHPHVAEVRQTGMILAIEMVADKQTKTAYPWQQRRGLKVYQHALKHQAMLRPLANTVYFMPPYVITPDEINHLARVAWDGINVATSDR